MKYISNAFSLNMLAVADGNEVIIKEISLSNAQTELLEFKEKVTGVYKRELAYSAIGHADICKIINNLIKTQYKVNRATIGLQHGDVLIVAQYSGPRLPEGTTQLPDGANIRWFKISIFSREYLHQEKTENAKNKKICKHIRLKVTEDSCKEEIMEELYNYASSIYGTIEDWIE